MTGPCLCGDPCCPSCGDPAQCAYEDAIEAMVDALTEQNLTMEELQLFQEVGKQAVESSRSMVKSVTGEMQFEHQQHVDHLLNKIEQLEGVNKS